MIEAAERPILYLGGGVVHSGAASAAVAVAERSSLPTVMTLMGLGALPTDHRAVARHARDARRAVHESRARRVRSPDRRRCALRRSGDRQARGVLPARRGDPRRHRRRRARQAPAARSSRFAATRAACSTRLLPRLRARRRSTLERAHRGARALPPAAPARARLAAQPLRAHPSRRGGTRRRRDRHDGRGSTPDVGRAGVPAAPRARLAHVGRPRHDGIRRAGRDRRRARGARSNGRVLLGRRLDPDEPAGARNGRGGRREREDRAAEQPLARARVSAADAVLRPARVRVRVSQVAGLRRA